MYGEVVMLLDPDLVDHCEVIVELCRQIGDKTDERRNLLLYPITAEDMPDTS